MTIDDLHQLAHQLGVTITAHYTGPGALEAIMRTRNLRKAIR